MSKFRVVQIQTTALAHLVVRNANGRKLFDVDIHGVTVTITTPLNAESTIEPDTARPQGSAPVSMTFTKEDRDFLKTVGISVEPTYDDIVQALAEQIEEHTTHDGTVKLLEKFRIHVTRENYLLLAFAGHPPQEPLDGEIEAQLPDGIRTDENTDGDDATCDAPSAGPCGEPSHTPYTQEETDAEED